MQKIEILWSGGWDSTFMLCLLARTKEAVIQPYYLNIKRHIQKDEHRAMREIMKVVRIKKDLKAKILPVKIVKQEYFKPSDEVVVAWKKYRGKPYLIGGQQQFIAEFSKSHKGICWGQERYLETPGHMTQLLLDKGNWKFTDDGVGYFTKEDCDPDVFILFGNLTCPIAKYSEPMMWEKIQEWGYEDVFKHICFCYYPIDGKPCGMCVPCKVKMKQKMDFLFDDNAFKRYRIYNELSKIKETLSGFSDWLDMATCFNLYVNPLFRKDFTEQRFGTGHPIDKIMQKKMEAVVDLYSDYFDSLLERESGSR